MLTKGQILKVCGIDARVEHDKFGWYLSALDNWQGNDVFFTGITETPYEWICKVLAVDHLSWTHLSFPAVTTETQLYMVIRNLALEHLRLRREAVEDASRELSDILEISSTEIK